jgi:hypothetical protein
VCRGGLIRRYIKRRLKDRIGGEELDGGMESTADDEGR